MNLEKTGAIWNPGVLHADGVFPTKTIGLSQVCKKTTFSPFLLFGATS
jgi:hypothetical protein